mgnify:FL=1
MKEKDSRYTYVIFALLCLIIFNIGTIFISAKGEKMEADVKPVFSQENIIKEKEDFFVFLFSRTSSAMSLYNKQVSDGIKWEEYFYNKNQLRDRFKDFFKAQFPSIIPFEKSKKENLQDPDYEDMNEVSVAVEDFIVIDKVDEYEDLITISDSEGNISYENLPKPLNIKPLKIDKEIPYILIYHTHGTESYSEIQKGVHHTTDRAYNITTIGENVAGILEDKGHKVEHITTYHDIPSYNKSYTRSLNTATEALQKNNNLKLLIDMHREGIELKDSSVKNNLDKYIDKFTTEINGKTVATFFFVIGPDTPNKEEVLNFAKYFKTISDIIYPGLCNGIHIKPRGKFNQFLSDHYMLVEMGSNLNTMEEVTETSKLFAELLDIVLQNIIE